MVFIISYLSSKWEECLQLVRRLISSAPLMGLPTPSYPCWSETPSWVQDVAIPTSISPVHQCVSLLAPLAHPKPPTHIFFTQMRDGITIPCWSLRTLNETQKLFPVCLQPLSSPSFPVSVILAFFFTPKLSRHSTSFPWQALPPGPLMTGSLWAFRMPFASLLSHLKNQICPVLPIFTKMAQFPVPHTVSRTENALRS